MGIHHLKIICVVEGKAERINLLQLLCRVICQYNMKVRIRENAWIARIAAWKLKTDSVAIVIGRTIYLYRTTRSEFLADTQWVCHELKHIAQFRQYGFARFIIYYLVESIRNGYYNNKFEVQARACEQDAGLLNGVHFV